MRPYPWPQANEVHIHCVDLTSEVARYLSPDEILRADRLFDPHKRDNFIKSRGLLRAILGSYLEIQPEELRFSTGPHGKPYLVNNRLLHFNLSHSGSQILLAIATDREVGIDLEEIRNDTSFQEMASLVFSPREQQELFSLPEQLQQSAFYLCWVRKEAYLKCCGMGFAMKSSSFDVSLLTESIISFQPPDDLSCWNLQDIIVPDNYCAALAVKGPYPEVRYINQIIL